MEINEGPFKRKTITIHNDLRCINYLEDKSDLFSSSLAYTASQQKMNNSNIAGKQI